MKITIGQATTPHVVIYSITVRNFKTSLILLPKSRFLSIFNRYLASKIEQSLKKEKCP